MEAAASGIIEYFDEHPDATSYSLGINDNRNFCETDPSHPHYPDKTNSIGLIDMSDIYYEWVNEVVEQVLEVYPDKWFGLLAYYNVMDPPSFPLNPRVVPFITKDRMAWIDEDIRAAGHQQVDEWNDVANQVGWYDYMYGTLYVLPRVFPHVMAENFQYAKQNQVYGHYIEMYHNVGDGPKAWIAAKLMWDPDQDVDTLMQEWYERTVGPEAASDLAAYFDLWEEFWTERIKDSSWFKNGKTRTYLPFTEASYVDLVTDEDILESKRLLDSVVDKTHTDQQKRRAKKFQRMFEYYEASALSYNDSHKFDPPEDETAALAMINSLLDSAERAKLVKKRYELIEEFEDDSALRFRIKPRIGWPGWNPYEFWHLVNYMTENESEGGRVTDKIHELANDTEPAVQRDVARLLKEANMGLSFSLTDNPSFEEGDEDAPTWNKWITSTGAINRVEGTARTGNASLIVDSMARGGPHQTFAIQPGFIATGISFYTPFGTEEGTIQLVTHAKNAQGKNLISFNSAVTGLSESAGQWSFLGQLEEIPVTVDGEEVTQVQFIVVIDGAKNAQVYLDDAVVYQYAPTSADIKAHVERFADEGEIVNGGTAHALKLHLTAVGRFEQQETAEKVIKHMEGFSRLLNHQRDNELISERAYNVLQDEAESMVKWWKDQ